MRNAVQSALAAAIIVVGTVNHDADAALHSNYSVVPPSFTSFNLGAFNAYPSVTAAMLPPPAAAPAIGPYVFVPHLAVPLFEPERTLMAIAPDSAPVDAGEATAEPVPPATLEIAPEPAVTPAAPSAVEAGPQVLPRPNPLRRRAARPNRMHDRAGRMAFDTPTLPPMAHTRFCMTYARECRSQKVRFRGGAIDLTAERRETLLRVNAEVNRAIRPVRVDETPVTEKWLISPAEGDCNDYAVTKRHKLLAEGWPARNLLLAEVVTDWGEHHLVLVVRTRDGDFVADNLTPTIGSFDKAPYQWVRAQSPENPKFWSTVMPPQAGMMAMVGNDPQL